MNTAKLVESNSTSAHRNGFFRRGALFFAVILVLLVVNQLWGFRVDWIAGNSMQPTLKNGQIVLIDQWPHTWAQLTGKPAPIEAGDVVEFDGTGIYPAEGPDMHIKRVLGLPGERITWDDDGQVWVNSQAATPISGGQLHGRDCRGVPIASVAKNESGPNNSATKHAITVASAAYFVVGDNRADSLDSRQLFAAPGAGLISESRIKGKVIATLPVVKVFSGCVR